MERRKAFWVLRYKTGDAFAVSNMWEEWVETSEIPGAEGFWAPPPELRLMVEDMDNDVMIMDYDIAHITEPEFETLREFGIPMVHSHMHYVKSERRHVMGLRIDTSNGDERV